MTLQKFRIDQEQTEEANIVHISGDLDLSAATELRSVLETVVNETDRALILDLGQLNYIDSTGIGIIISVVKIRDEIQGAFHARHIPTNIMKLFDITGISGFLFERK